jgi:hypothetical protein
MTTFDDREKAFESKFAHDQEIEFKAHARRARLAGLWAGEQMGLEGEHLEEYARAVVKSDFEQPGPDDVLRKILLDFQAAHVHLSEAAVRQKMEELLAVARAQVQAAAG